MSFENQVVLVTGGSSGIGLATARLFAAQGAHVWLMARRREQLEAACAQVEACRKDPGQQVGFVAADVSSFDQVDSAVAQITARSGVPDLVINSAGSTYAGFFQDISLDTFRELMDINYFGTVHTIKAVLPGMLRRGSGHLVNISSLAGHIGVFGYTAYGPTKFAIWGLSDALRMELKPQGLHVSLVVPPDTDTPQLAYDKQIRPPEISILWFGDVPMVPVEKVAGSILKGVSRKKYLIFPSWDTKFFFRLSQVVGGGAYPILDYLLARARRELKRKKEKS